MKCQHCGAPMTDDAKFCSHCGAPAPEKQPESRCHACGQLLPEQAVFCTNCGAPVDRAFTTTSANSAPTSTDTTVQVSTTNTEQEAASHTTQTQAAEVPHTDAQDAVASNADEQQTQAADSAPVQQAQQAQSASKAPHYDLDPFELNEIDGFKFILTKKYAEFDGRASRSEYFRFCLVYGIILAILMVLAGLIGLVASGIVTSIITYVLLTIVSLALLVPGLAVAIRRLHDINKPGLYVLVNFIPFVGPIWYLILTLTKGDEGPNLYGERTSYITVTPEIQQQYGIKASPTSTLTAIFIAAYIILFGIGSGLLMHSMTKDITTN